MSPARTASQLARLVRELLRPPAETEWLEDKEENNKPEEMQIRPLHLLDG